MNDLSNQMKEPMKIVLTGGPGVGKTSILRYLREIKYDVREEVFTKLFGEAHELGKLNDEFLHSAELISGLISAQKLIESQPIQGELVFFDRSRVDILAFARNQGITLEENDKAWLERNAYDLVFAIEPLPEKYYDQNSIRRQSRSESLEHHQQIVECYIQYFKINNQDHSRRLVKVPFLSGEAEDSIRKRTQFILTKIQSLS